MEAAEAQERVEDVGRERPWFIVSEYCSGGSLVVEGEEGECWGCVDSSG
jgi:hypothetical protein